MGTKKQYCNPEIWGGIECTINRVGNEYRNQLADAGCYHRNDDIEHIASLGIRALRFPVLWEQHVTRKDEAINWQWTEARLNELRKNNITPIAGLLHHGSGPAFTGLYENDFPELLAEYAGKVAAQFPWIEYYTPVNEPLTTARFSGLYGLWYPHHKNTYSFLKMLLNQLKAVVLSMKAIREINPSAKLVQTEDLAKIHGSRKLKYQCDFENERRWLTYDLLCGRLDKKHKLWNWLISAGIKKSELDFFLEHPCPPDIAGFNYYVTSERYLDKNIQNHPPHTHGGNGKHVYADVEAVRVTKPHGVKKLLHEAWNRFHLPMALTEVHLGCTREEQMRWFREIWEESCSAVKEGIEIKAITAWSLLGSYDWNSLLTNRQLVYESGVFDIRNDHLRETALAKLVAHTAEETAFDHPVLSGSGWWHPKKVQSSHTSPLLIIGKTGTLGHAFTKLCEQRGLHYRAVSRADLNILDAASITKMIEQERPWAVINAAGYVRVDDAETDRENCFAVNTHAPVLLSQACAAHGIQFMNFSTDLVFGGQKKSPYTESDIVNPLNVYGESKAVAEQKIMAVNSDALIIRTSAFFGPWDKSNFAWHVLNTLDQHPHCAVSKDGIVSPTYVPDLVNASLDILIDAEKGIWHVSNMGIISWTDFAAQVAERGGHAKTKLVTKLPHELGWKAVRPSFSALNSQRGIQLPTFENAMERYFNEKIF